jgi:DNA-binding NarL/FixJ family response regulator
MLSMMFKIWFQQLGLDVEVVATPTNGKATLEAVRKYQPDVLVQDMMLHDMDGVSIIQHLRVDFPKLRIFAMSAKPAYAKAALDAGADGCMLKEDHPQVIRQALEWDLSKGKWVSPLLQDKILNAVANMRKYDFTQSEMNVLRLAHLPNLDIASALGLSEGTVRNLFTVVYQKTGTTIRAELADLAHNVLLLNPSPDAR